MQMEDDPLLINPKTMKFSRILLDKNNLSYQFQINYGKFY